MARPPPLKPVPSFKSPNVRLALSDADGLTPRTPHSSRKSGYTNASIRSGLGTAELDEVDLLQSPDKQRLLRVPNTSGLESGGASPTGTASPLRSPWANTINSRLTTFLTVLFAVIVIGLTGISVLAPEILNSNSDPAELLAPPLPPALKPSGPSFMPTPTWEVQLDEVESQPTATVVAIPHPSNPPNEPVDQERPAPNRIIDYSNYTSFPLTPHQYAEECWSQLSYKSHGGYWAESHHGGTADVATHKSDSDSRYCSNSITYMLDGTSSGLVAELALLAQVAGLAREVRSLIGFWLMLLCTNAHTASYSESARSSYSIQDGTGECKIKSSGSGMENVILTLALRLHRWSDYFSTIPSHTADTPEPGCLPPPPEELVACPRLAKCVPDLYFSLAMLLIAHDLAIG